MVHSSGITGGSLAAGARTPCTRRGLPELFTHSFPSHRDTPPLLHLLAGAWSHSSGLHAHVAIAARGISQHRLISPWNRKLLLAPHNVEPLRFLVVPGSVDSVWRRWSWAPFISSARAPRCLATHGGWRRCAAGLLGPRRSSCNQQNPSGGRSQGRSCCHDRSPAPRRG